MNATNHQSQVNEIISHGGGCGGGVGGRGDGNENRRFNVAMAGFIIVILVLVMSYSTRDRSLNVLCHMPCFFYLAFISLRPFSGQIHQCQSHGVPSYSRQRYIRLSQQNWRTCQALLNKTGKEGVMRRIGKFQPKDGNAKTAAQAKSILEPYSREQIRDVSAGAATFYLWVCIQSFFDCDFTNTNNNFTIANINSCQLVVEIARFRNDDVKMEIDGHKGILVVCIAGGFVPMVSVC